METLGGTRNVVLDGGPDLFMIGEGENVAHCVIYHIHDIYDFKNCHCHCIICI